MKKFLVTYNAPVIVNDATKNSTEIVEASYMYIADAAAVFYNDDKKAIGVIPLGNVRSILPVKP